MPEAPDPSLRDLRDPLVVTAFSGWSDAGNAASAAVEHLAEAYGAEIAFSIEPDDFYDYQVNRPQVSLSEDGRRQITWPTTDVLVGELSSGQDLVLVRGLEPNMRWRQFGGLLTSALRSAKPTRVFMLGALLADTPHTRPVPISVTTADATLATAYAISESTYEGPTGIVGVLADLLARAEIPTISLWAAIPHYVSHPPCPKATLALLSRLEQMLESSLDLGELAELSKAWERGVAELAAEDSEVAEYVSQLEEQQDATELPEASGDAIAAEFERYLRRRQGH